MLITNGHITLESSVSGSVLDPETGFYVPGEEVEESFIKIECQYRTNNRNDVGKVEENAFTLASYTALIEQQEFPMSGAIVNLFDKKDCMIGRFQVIRVDDLPHVGQFKLYLK